MTKIDRDAIWSKSRPANPKDGDVWYDQKKSPARKMTFRDGEWFIAPGQDVYMDDWKASGMIYDKSAGIWKPAA